MIRHIVIWRLNAEAKVAGQIKDIALIQRSVASLRSAVPGLLRMELGINQSPLADAADLLLYSEFESWQALRGYDDHPLHEELRALIRPLRTERRVIDHEF
jgi:hypothetical protein